jgi:hypothetical protein
VAKAAFLIERTITRSQQCCRGVPAAIPPAWCTHSPACRGLARPRGATSVAPCLKIRAIVFYRSTWQSLPSRAVNAASSGRED